MKTNTIIFSLCIFLVNLPLKGQVVLENYMQEGLKNNLALKQEGLYLDKSIEQLKQARGMFLPNISFNSSYTVAQGGRKLEFPIGDLLNPVYSTLNQLTESKNFPQVQNQQIQFLPNNFQDTRLTVYQSIFNTDLYFSYKAQKDLVTVQQAKKQAFTNELKNQIAVAYYQFLQANEAVKIYESAQETLTEMKRVNEKLVNNGMRTKDVYYQAEYELSKIETQLSEAVKNEVLAKAYFNFLLNRDLDSEIIIDSNVIESVYAQDQKTLEEKAINDRPELRQMSHAINANKNIVSLYRYGKFLPNFSLAGNAGYQGFKYKFDNTQRYGLVQFNLQWNIFSGGIKRSKLHAANLDLALVESQYEQLKKQISLQVTQGVQEIKYAENAEESAKKGLESAENSYRIVQKRYEQSQALWLELMDAQNKVLQAKLSLTIAKYNSKIKEVTLNKIIANI